MTRPKLDLGGAPPVALSDVRDARGNCDPGTAALGASGPESGHRAPESGGQAPDDYSCSPIQRPVPISSVELGRTISSP
ncbi:hypothetical protein Efla_003398 [Eimeria flavescens]